MNGANRLVKAGYLVACFGAAFGTTSAGLLLSLAGWAAAAMRGKASWRFSHRIYWFFVALLGVMALSALVSPVRPVAAWLTLGFALVLAGFVFGSQWTGSDKSFLARRLAPTLIAASTLSYLATIIRYLVLYPARAEGFVVGSNGLGTIIIMCTGLSLGCLGAWKSAWRYAAMPLYFLLAGVTLLITYSRGAWFGFLAMLVAFGVSNRKARGWTLLGMGGLAGALASVPSLHARFLSALHLAGNESRLFIWRATLRMIKAYPVLGVGAGVYMHVSKRFALPGAPYPVAAFAHNLFLQVLAEFGLVGFAVFMAILIQVFVMAWRLARTGHTAYQGIFAALIGIVVHQQVDIPIWGLEIGGAFWLLVGITISLYVHELCTRELGSGRGLTSGASNIGAVVR